MKSLFIEKNLDSYLQMFNLTRRGFYRDRLLIAAALGGSLFLLASVQGSPTFYTLAMLGIYAGYKYPYYNLYTQKVASDERKRYAFPSFLGTFITLLPTQGNTYQVLVECIPHVDPLLQPKLKELTEKVAIDNDYMHYWEFAEHIGTTEAQMVMSMIYSFSEAGARKEELDELESLVGSIQENKMKEAIRKKAESQERFSNYPILLAVVFVLVFVGVVLVDSLRNFTNFI